MVLTFDSDISELTHHLLGMIKYYNNDNREHPFGRIQQKGNHSRKRLGKYLKSLIIIKILTKE